MNRMYPPRATLVIVAALMACEAPSDDDRFRPVADVQELMLHIVEPAAQTYWGAVGWVLDAEGERYIRPTTEEEWLAVENAAFMVAESGNLLMMAERSLDDDGWVTMSQSLVDVGERALRAAEAMDEQRVFDLGAEVYYVCSNCHAAYSPGILRPSDERFPGGEGVEGDRPEESGSAGGRGAAAASDDPGESGR